ncbi:MAG: hypothetical protein QM817_10215 [Archangium sp.]
MKCEIGTRVVAISHTTAERVFIFGFGTYDGSEAPTSFGDLTPFARSFLQFFGTPRIRLDSGKVVYGYECWWGEADGFEQDGRGGRELVTIDIDDARAVAAARSLIARCHDDESHCPTWSDGCRCDRGGDA